MDLHPDIRVIVDTKPKTAVGPEGETAPAAAGAVANGKEGGGLVEGRDGGLGSLRVVTMDELLPFAYRKSDWSGASSR